jgi:opacity protein-like surface antigen
MRTTVWVGAVVAILGVAMPARAQDKKVEGNIGGGYSATTGEARQHTGDAGVFEAGVTFNVTPTMGFKTNYNYTGLGKEKTVTVPVSPTPGGATTLQEFSADAHMHDVTFDLVVKAPARSRVAPYGIVGPGIYHRTINLTTPAVGFTTICDPFWYVCYPVPVAVDQVIGSRSSTDFGMNFGGGFSFKVGEKASLYFDIRYIYIWGPTFDVPAIGSTPAHSVRANGQAVPFIFGVRF